MTLRLVLIRHAKSDWGDPTLPDHARPLNRRGRRDAPRMGVWIAAQGAVPARVLCSDAVRTRETLALMLPAWSPAPEVEHRAALYHATPEAMVSLLEAEATASPLALVGHNPGLGQLAARLARRAPDHARWHDYPTCAVAVLDFAMADWSALRDGQGRVHAFAVPADLPREGRPR
ncbi:histidine phosphatase family protein [Rubellimicrobium sp. CFH 75288]|uniref:SixA phosphatase family protein n=1 Tax=Rubellimicrobium sp. CFH 75288 TaxID=2697034 RepID=UPI001412C267|nr:histidine phosphatase family protein [Rubellimicrobium sp. CFH 75288]NAZ35869.1 histidine phosphatase family protein [Rubellimicrobium sp. CFH 75288]